MFDLAGKVAIVSGVSSGLGRSLAATLCSYGMTVVGLARRVEEGAALAKDIAGSGGCFEFVQGDVAVRDDCEKASSLCQHRYGKIDILINNAGIVGGSDLDLIEGTSDEQWDHVHAINLRGAFLLSRAVLPVMRAQQDGVILMIASQAAVWGLEGLGAYNASKAGMVALGKTIAVEGWPNIRCNSIILGSTETAAAKTASAGVSKRGTPIGAPVRRVRMQADEVARSVAVLCLPEARMITGAEIAIDQAFVAGRAMSRLMRVMNGVELD